MTVAAVDRLVHHATIIEIRQESFRQKTALSRSHFPSLKKKRWQSDDLICVEGYSEVTLRAEYAPRDRPGPTRCVFPVLDAVIRVMPLGKISHHSLPHQSIPK